MQFFQSAAILATAVLASACTTTPPPPTSPAAVGERLHGSGYRLVNGYLQKSDWVDSLALLPAPPAEGSPAMADDVAAYHRFIALRGTPRDAIATRDAKLSFAKAEETPFSCALGIPISEEATPHVNILLRRVLTDAGTATFGAKDHYKRTRPFMAFKGHSCTPDEEHVLTKDGSYPSGHSSAGWAQALVLAEIAPDRRDALLQRGRAYGQSRAICGAHWKSDIVAGRMIGAAMVVKLHNNPQFMAQLEAARGEIAKARAAGSKPTSDCATEAAALTTTSKLEP
ncbi:acid phosphatase [Noviherbaspirillum saxi]|uniref:Acid phosphatase n=1 Tax=Noviherbaspirillum saxi TaxID=2320863 RepID=A0A3A3FGM7_9BURK|nr:phosphatase PAP2 family protein [Noviherbaspirillum saxi]RJF92541.1 phosphatase PAP2 family protein [Noviherbaspirillum saxi]